MRNKKLLRAAVFGALALPLGAQAQEPSIQDLLKRIEEQDQKILVLERKLEIQDETAASAKESTAVVSAGPKGFSLKSADGKNQLKLRGTLHLDGRYLDGDDPGGTFDTFTATRVRPTIEGTFASIFDFKLMPDFGQGRTVIQDAYVAARFVPAAQLTVGKFKSPVGLERLQSANDIRWVARAYPTSLAPNRDIGIQLGGDLAGEERVICGRYPRGPDGQPEHAVVGGAEGGGFGELAFGALGDPLLLRERWEADAELLHGRDVDRLVDGAGAEGDDEFARAAEEEAQEAGEEFGAADPVHEILAGCHRAAHHGHEADREQHHGPLPGQHRIGK